MLNVSFNNFQERIRTCLYHQPHRPTVNIHPTSGDWVILIQSETNYGFRLHVKLFIFRANEDNTQLIWASVPFCMSDHCLCRSGNCSHALQFY